MSRSMQTTKKQWRPGGCQHIVFFLFCSCCQQAAQATQAAALESATKASACTIETRTYLQSFLPRRYMMPR